MSFVRPSPLLRRALRLDAAACAAMGLLLALGATVLTGPLGLPVALLRGAGLALLPCAAALALLSRPERLPRLAVLLVIGVNLLWIADSLLVLIAGWFAPTALGVAFVLIQAAAVAIVTELEVIGLRRSGAAEVLT